MKKWLLLFFMLPFICLAQTPSDDVFILLKKGAHLKTYATGMSFSMETIYQQWFDGTITAIRNDSIFLNGIPFHYKEIQTVRIGRTKLNYNADGLILIVAGGGVLVLGAVNGLYRGDQFKDWYKPSGFITAGAFLALGLLLLKSRYKNYALGKKYSLQYLELNPNKNKAGSL